MINSSPEYLETIPARVHQAQVAQLYDQSGPGAAGAVIGSLVVTYTLWDLVPKAYLVVWQVSYFFLHIFRRVVAYRYHRKNPDIHEARRWGYYHCISATIGTFYWGLAAIFLFPSGAIYHEFVLAVCITGITTAAVAVFFPTSCYIFCIPAGLFPLAGRFFYEGGEHDVIIGAVILLFSGVLVIIGRSMHRVNAESLMLRFERGDLIESLQQQIQERLVAEDNLKRSEKYYRAVVEDQTELICRFSLELTPLFLNDAFRRFFGIYGEISAPTFSSVTGITSDLIGRTHGSPDTMNYETFVVASGNETRWVQWTIREISGFDSFKEAEFQAVGRDLTMRRRMEEQLEDAVNDALELSRKAEAANIAKSQFLANMSHELRTPLNAIIGFSDLMTTEIFGPINDKYMEFIKEVSNAGKHLLELVNQVLDLSKIEAGRVELDLSGEYVSDILENSFMVIKELTMRKQIALKSYIDPLLSEKPVLVDGIKVKQIVYNLLSNAAKFTPDGGEIILTAGISEEQIRVSVTDTGIGIPPEACERIFLEFEQLDPSFARDKQQGTGLGLSLVRKLVELHGGKVWVESAGVNQGSTFTFTLPYMPTFSSQHKHMQSQREEIADESASTPSSTSLILVIEDNQANMKLITAMLEVEGYGIEKAWTAEEGLKAAEQMYPDVILMDISLPGMDGMTALRTLKEMEELREIPVIAVTAHALEYDRSKAIEAGFSAYVTKPINQRELLEAIETAIQTKNIPAE